MITRGLKELRDKSVFFFAMFNALFVLIVFMLTLNKDILHIDWPFGVKTNITITDDNQVSCDYDHVESNICMYIISIYNDDNSSAIVSFSSFLINGIKIFLHVKKWISSMQITISKSCSGVQFYVINSSVANITCSSLMLKIIADVTKQRTFLHPGKYICITILNNESSIARTSSNAKY